MTNYMIRRVFQMMIVVLMSTMAIYVLFNVAPAARSLAYGFLPIGPLG